MSEFRVNYLDSGNNKAVLATEHSVGLTVKELPFNPQEKNIFIRKSFVGFEAKYWKVLEIDIYDGVAGIVSCDILVEAVPYISRSVSEQHGKNGSKLVRGRILECDFGYFSQEIASDLATGTTVANMNSKLPYEMVKRRLVVVISAKEDPALVVPLSKSDKAKDPRTVVKVESVPDDLVTFKEPICYAKAASVSLVSGHRLFPLRYFNGEQKKIYDKKIEKKLSNEEVVAIKEAVLTAVGGANILYSAEQISKENEGLKVLLDDALRDLNEVREQKAELEALLDSYTEA